MNTVFYTDGTKVFPENETATLSSDNFTGLIFTPSNEICFTQVREDEPVFTPVKRDGDADYDLFASIDTVVNPGEIVKVHTNLAIEYPNGWEGKIEDKSGVSARGVHVLGGVIDNIYTGEHLIVVVNLGKNTILFRSGEKVAQLKVRQKSPNFKFIKVNRPLKQTERGDKGFGSTGK